MGDVVGEGLLQTLRFAGQLVRQLEYGENGWQTPAGFYTTRSDKLDLNNLQLLEGREPSYNNLIDIHRLLQTMTHIAAAFQLNQSSIPSIAIAVKHGNCCGAAVSWDPMRAIRDMIDGNPMSISGGLVMTNFEVNQEHAFELRHYAVKIGDKRVVDGVIAPAFTAEALAELARKEGKCRLLRLRELDSFLVTQLDNTQMIRQVRGGFLVQPNYTHVLDLGSGNLEKIGPKIDFISDVLLAWAICATSNSNTITLVRHGKLIGNGNGQDSRVLAAKLAVMKARDSGHDTTRAVACSDSFFPFVDGPQVLADANVSLVLTTSGSRNDAEVRAFFEERGIALWWMPDKIGRMFFGH